MRYLFGEIMYGGHITDDWDRRLCRTYLGEYIRLEMLEGEMPLAPGFLIPPNSDYKVRRVGIILTTCSAGNHFEARKVRLWPLEEI